MVTLPGIYDSASALKVKVSNEHMMGLGNDEIYDFKFFMKVRDMGFLHESKMGPGKIIQRHAHKGDILNFVLDGSLNINGKTYTKTGTSSRRTHVTPALWVTPVSMPSCFVALPRTPAMPPMWRHGSTMTHLSHHRHLTNISCWDTKFHTTQL